MAEQPVAVVVIDDHPIFRQGLAAAVAAAPDLALAGSFDSVESLGDLRTVDVAILDLGLPGLSGAQAVAHLRSLDVAVLVVSAQGERGPVVAAFGAGAGGYLTKSAEPAEIMHAALTIARGGTYVSPTLAAFLIESSDDSGAADAFVLTPRERDVLGLVAAGERDLDIAEQLGISLSTVRSHLDRIRDKTGRRRRSELTRLAIDQGLIGDRDRSD